LAKKSASQARHDPVAGNVHLVRDLDRDHVEGAPRVVADQPRRDEREGDQRDDRAGRG
jgi:hypothetical protein